MKISSLFAITNLLDTLIKLSIISEADKAPVKNHFLNEILLASDNEKDTKQS